MKKEVLTRPFAPELLKQRPGSHGKQVTYVDVASVIARLNDGCDAWDFLVEKYEVTEREVFVLARLVADGVTKSAFGGSTLTLDRQGKVVSVADDLKAAASDALKKCASLLGVGLEIYGGQIAEPVKASAASKPVDRTTPPQQPRQGNSAGGAQRSTLTDESSFERATVRQLAAIHATSRRKGLSKERLANFIQRHCGRADLAELTRAEASSVLDSLNRSMH